MHALLLQHHKSNLLPVANITTQDSKKAAQNHIITELCVHLLFFELETVRNDGKEKNVYQRPSWDQHLQLLVESDNLAAFQSFANFITCA